MRHMTRHGLSAVLMLATALPAAGQEWRLGAQVGQIHYDGSAAASATTGTSLALAVSRASARDWLGVTAGVPLQDQPAWLVGGLWKQWRQRAEWGIGADISGHAFVQRELATTQNHPLPPLEPAEPDRSGQGAGGEAAILAFAGTGPLRLEVRGGAAGQSSTVADVSTSRLLPLATARGSLALVPVRVSLEGRRWWGADSAHTYAGASAEFARSSFVIWASAGSWLSGGSEGAVLAAGAVLGLSERIQLEGSWREAAFDPLYGSTTARSFSLGMSLRLGDGDVVHAPVPARIENGRAVIRIPSDEVAGAPQIAGDFTGWQPRPMTARDGAWEYSVALGPGVYTYAFVNAAGEWFVPESTPGRRSDGMGGYQAVLIVGE